ncbi:hypothetical protein GC096_30730 [Paenibacillus sp. LMG 31461]|uniref:Uncharacterized protein n=1 Tax=Paenibacillus plantarum TaxID=2654975 RepID=A0ABX1XK06_9BACL|nr:hypothetical protein [Paenibacillus plantarum]NOU68406.1 hypothetical protein [Paenibacillus plantarum]
MLLSFIKANNFPWVTLKRYWKNSTKSELLVDVFLPIVIAIIMTYFTALSVTKFTVLIEKFQQISGQVIAAISILAGFNVASITIIATVSSGPLLVLRTRLPGAQLSRYEMLICFFTWAVIIQLTVVLISIVLFYMGSFIPEHIKDWGVPMWAWCCAVFWLSITIHSIFLSVRNMKTLYLYVTYE